jgi:uncharacterized repeat protein (TIGR01451 family)
VPNLPEIHLQSVRRASALVLACLIGLLAGPSALAGSATGADLRLRMTSDARGRLRPGDRVTYRVTISNRGDTAATADLVDAFPAGLHVLAVRPFDEGTCDLTSTIDSQGHDVAGAWCHLTSLAPGATLEIEFAGAVAHDAGCGTLRNRASVDSPDEPRANDGRENYAAVDDEVACTCGLALRSSVHPAAAPPGAQVRTRYVIRNTGDGAASVVVHDGRLGVVRTLTRVAPGSARTVSASWRLPARGAAVSRGSRAIATLSDGTTCADAARATVRIVHTRAPSPPPRSPGGTPFTGSSGLPLGAFLTLLATGLAALWIARRRTS